MVCIRERAMHTKFLSEILKVGDHVGERLKWQDISREIVCEGTKWITYSV